MLLTCLPAQLNYWVDSHFGEAFFNSCKVGGRGDGLSACRVGMLAGMGIGMMSNPITILLWYETLKTRFVGPSPWRVPSDIVASM